LTAVQNGFPHPPVQAPKAGDTCAFEPLTVGGVPVG